MVQELSTPAGCAEALPEPLVVVVVLSWNNRGDTIECLQSVGRLSYNAKRVILVDNGSTDGTTPTVRERFPSVRVVETGRNLGVPAGYNVGIREALADGAAYVLVLNNDAVVASDLLQRLLAVAAENPRAGILMPTVLRYDAPNVVWSSGARYRRFPPAIVFIDRNRSDDLQSDRPRPIAYAPACGLLIRREVFEAVGLFDSGYFFFYEDWDLSERVRAAGMSILHVPAARMWHKISRTTRQTSETYWRVWGESSARFYRRYGGPAFLSVSLHVGYLLARELVMGNVRSLPIFVSGVRSGLAKPPDEASRCAGDRRPVLYRDKSSVGEGETLRFDGRSDLPSTIIVEDQTVLFEYAACNGCGSHLEEEVFRGLDRLHRFPGTFRVVRCVECGLLRQNPRPTGETIGAYYPKTYEPFAPALCDETNPLRRLDRWYGMYKRRRLVERHQPGGTILDVGCATGNFLAEMKRTGKWQVVGIEPNDHAATQARARHGLDVQVGRLANVPLPAETFDVVTLWNVVEHLHEPIDDLRRVARSLKPGGHLVLSLPNLESVEVRLFANRWFGWELPRHLYFFSRRTLENALDTLHLTVVDRVNLSGSQISFALSLQYMYSDRKTVPFWNRVASKVVPSLPARVFLLPTFYAFARLGHATSVTVVARKRA